MSRKLFIDAFFNQFSDFLNELIRVFPSDTDFPTFKTALHLLQKTNPMLVITQVKAYTDPYAEMIASKNESFFIQHDYSEHVEGDDAVQQIIQKLKGLWEALTPNNKKVVWDYVKVIRDLAIRCSGL
jgi:hypothetical protein